MVCRGQQRQQPHLRTVAMRNDDFVAFGDRRNALRGGPNVGALVVCGHGLAPLEQRVAAKGDDDSHDQRSAATRTAFIVCIRFSA